MRVLTRDVSINTRTGEWVYKNATYPYRESTNDFGPAQDFSEYLAQACVKRLMTQCRIERAYSYDYGIDWILIRTMPTGWIYTKLPDMIKECLMRDDRVSDVGVSLEDVKSDSMLITLTINNVITTEVNINYE